MKWYFWVLIVLALIITVIVVAAAINSGKKTSSKVESDIAKSSSDALATTRSATYTSLDRIVSAKSTCGCTKVRDDGSKYNWNQPCPCPQGSTGGLVIR